MGRTPFLACRVSTPSRGRQRPSIDLEPRRPPPDRELPTVSGNRGVPPLGRPRTHDHADTIQLVRLDDVGERLDCWFGRGTRQGSTETFCEFVTFPYKTQRTELENARLADYTVPSANRLRRRSIPEIQARLR
jgi:hypothetical protein